MTGLIILAAGASKRIGKPKQLLRYKGKSFIRRTVKAGIDSGCKPIVVVLGAHFAEILPEIVLNTVHIVHNNEWEEGMASSIRTGLTKILETDPYIDDVIFMLCDQPMVDVNLLKSLIRKRQTTGMKIISCAYGNTYGVPVLFNNAYFPELLELHGEEGAKKLLFNHQDDEASVAFPAGSIDIDTPDDYQSLE